MTSPLYIALVLYFFIHVPSEDIYIYISVFNTRLFSLITKQRWVFIFLSLFLLFFPECQRFTLQFLLDFFVYIYLLEMLNSLPHIIFLILFYSSHSVLFRILLIYQAISAFFFLSLFFNLLFLSKYFLNSLF